MAVKGWFYLKKTATGNLIGEFSNNNLDHVVTECANLINRESNSYIGEYNSVWSESNVSDRYRLKIYLKSNSSSIYKLEWLNDNSSNKTKLVYEGEGFIADGFLIGRYESVG